MNSKIVTLSFKNLFALHVGIKDYVNIATPDTSPLMIACQTNCSKCINCLLNHNADVNLVTSNQVTILHFVAEFCGPDVLDRIMERFELSRLPNFTDLNDERIFEMINPLHLAISSSNMNMIKYFIEKQLFTVDSFQAIGRGNAIHNLAIESKLLISALGFALSIGASRSIIDYLIQSGARLDLYSDLVVPPVFCGNYNYNFYTHYVHSPIVNQNFCFFFKFSVI